MKRRNFFALLLAPFVARFLPKIKSNVTMPADFRFCIKPGSLDEMTRIQTQLTQIMIQHIYSPDRRIKILGPNGITLADFESPHDETPFVIFET